MDMSLKTMHLAEGLLLLLLTACRPAAPDPGRMEQDWTMYRGDPALSGYTAQPLPQHPALLWEYRSGIRCVSSPVVYGGTTYFCHRRGGLKGLDDQGRLVFEYDLGAAVEAPLLVADSVLYLGRMDGTVCALSLKEKKLLWSAETEGQISAAPVLAQSGDRRRLVVGSYDNCMYTFDLADGTVVGKIPTGYYLNGAAALQQDYALFGGCDAWLRILHLPSGQVTDSFKLEAYIPASPALWEDMVHVADYQGNLYQFKLSGGKITGLRKLLAGSDDTEGMTSMPAVGPRQTIVLYRGRHLCCLGRDGQLRWQTLLKSATGDSSPLICGKQVLSCTGNGMVSIHDLADGRLLWEYETGEQVVASPVVSGGRFFILTAKGSLLCFGESSSSQS